MKVAKEVAWLLALTGVVGCGNGTDGVMEPPSPPTAPQVMIANVSGSNQIGKAGELLPEPFVVRVTDANGVGAANVPVTWTVTSGGGDIFEWDHVRQRTTWTYVSSTRTRSDGLAEVAFLPTRLGRTSVTATTAGLAGGPAIFTTDATALVIQNAFWGYFLAPNDSADVTVPVGTEVEWLNLYGPVQIKSTSAPPGGAAFRITLGLNERFQLVPSVPGTWEWTYQYLDASGEPTGSSDRGTLTAR